MSRGHADPTGRFGRWAAIPLLAAALLAPTCSRNAGPSSAALPPAPPPKRLATTEILALTRDPEAKVILLNVWATWCGPCREEFPSLVRLHRELESKGVKVVLVSADFDVSEDKLVEFLTSQAVDFPTYQRTDNDKDFIEVLNPDWSGAMPATFVYSSDGSLRDFWEGKATYDTFREKVDEALSAANG